MIKKIAILALISTNALFGASVFVETSSDRAASSSSARPSKANIADAVRGLKSSDIATQQVYEGQINEWLRGDDISIIQDIYYYARIQKNETLMQRAVRIGAKPDVTETSSKRNITSLKTMCAKAIAQDGDLMQQTADLLPPLICKDPFVEYVNNALKQRIGFREPRVLDGHKFCALSIAFSPDRNILASGSIDGTIRLWNQRTGECTHTLPEDTGVIRCIAFSPDGNTLASIIDTIVGMTQETDKNIRLRNMHTGTCTHTLEGHTHPVVHIAFSPDGNTLASASRDNTIRLWNSRTGTCTRTLQQDIGRIGYIAFSPDGNTLASASRDNTIRLWDLRTGKCTHTLQGHTDSVCHIAFSPDGNTLASTSRDNTIRLWNPRTGKCTRTLQQDIGLIGCIAFSPDGNILATASWDGTIRLRDPHTGTCTHTLRWYTSHLLDIAFSPDGNTLASASSDKTIRLWENYRNELQTFASNKEMQEFLIEAAHDWHEGRAHYVEHGNPLYQELIARFAHFNDERLFTHGRSEQSRHTYAAWVTAVVAIACKAIWLWNKK